MSRDTALAVLALVIGVLIASAYLIALARGGR